MAVVTDEVFAFQPFEIKGFALRARVIMGHHGDEGHFSDDPLLKLWPIFPDAPYTEIDRALAEGR